MLAIYSRLRCSFPPSAFASAWPWNSCSVTAVPLTDTGARRMLTTKQRRRGKGTNDMQHTLPSERLQKKEEKTLDAHHTLHYSPLITCQPGLETILSEELSSLQMPHSTTDQRHVLQIKPIASMEQILRCQLHLGTASQILLPLHAQPFAARGLHQLQRKVERLSWRDVLDINELLSNQLTLQVKVASSKSKLMHTTAIRDCIARAIYTSLGASDDDSTSAIVLNKTEEYGVLPMVVLQVSVVRDMVQIAVQSSPNPLHRRNYRLQTAKAPLREDLAYAMLYASGWTPDIQKTNRYNGMLDPLCGSGTIAIEAAAMACGLPPGRLRPPAFEGSKLCDPVLWNKLLLQSQPLATDTTDNRPVRIIASDRDKGAIVVAKANAERAGVLDMIEFADCAISSQRIFEEPHKAPSSLLLATNLPFGRRISKSRHTKDQSRKHHPMLPLYQTLASKITSLRDAGVDVSAMALVHDMVLAKQGFYGLQFQPKFQSSHGGLRIFGMYSPCNNQ